MPNVLNAESLRASLERLHAANHTIALAYPGERADRQPVHTVYGGAHLFAHDLAPRMGETATQALETYAPDARTFANAIGLDARLAEAVYARVIEKLAHEPVEDYRVDFEDGYGNRPETEEDAHARAAAQQMARGAIEHTLPPFVGIRIKPLTDEWLERSLRTLELFVTTLVEGTRGTLPKGFVVTLPKITASEQVSTLVDSFELLERATGLLPGAIQLELMVETTQSIFGPHGQSLLPDFVNAARGRCRGAHFGVYDYTAACGITAAHQRPRHPACDFARHVMQVTLAGTGVTLSDGATAIMPVAPHVARDGGKLSAAEREANTRAVHHAWRTHYDDVRHSLEHAYYQGWDLHPAQLPTRYAAVFAFFLEAREEAAVRLRAFVDKAAQATLVGNVFDDAATGQALLNFFLRGMNCGALTEEEALATGLTLAELRGRSFVKILNARRERGG
jgi:hypothetical protein